MHGHFGQLKASKIHKYKKPCYLAKIPIDFVHMLVTFL